MTKRNRCKVRRPWHSMRGRERAERPERQDLDEGGKPRKFSTAGRLYISVRECAEILGVDVRTVYRAIQRGELDALRIGGCWRVSVEGLGGLRQTATPPPAARATRPLPEVGVSAFVFLPPPGRLPAERGGHRGRRKDASSGDG